MGLTAELAALGTATEEGPVERVVVRQFFHNGLAVYDAAGNRFGVVADHDRPGGGFVVHLVQTPAGPLLSRVLRLLSGLMRTEEASA